MPQEDPIELFRSQDPGALKHVATVLDDAEIAHQLITDEGGFDITSIGAGEESEKFIYIQVSDYETARAALEADSLKTDLPEGHHLLHASDEELIDVVTHASEWSAFDTAHARRLLEEHGIDASKLEADRSERVERLKQGKPASKKLIFFGWFFSILGGFIGIAVAWSLQHMKIKTPDGEFHKYDRTSRDLGAKMFKVGMFVAAVVLFVRFGI